MVASLKHGSAELARAIHRLTTARSDTGELVTVCLTPVR